MNTRGKCLQLDVGNSSTKWRLRQDDRVLERGTVAKDGSTAVAATALAATALAEMLACTSTLEAIWVASVAGAATEQKLTAQLHKQWGIDPWYARSEAVTGDLRNSYRDPSRMGVDRWLAMLGGRDRYRERLCVVDAGSALTIDLVTADGQHEGGYIIPGVQLMERALLLDTDRVRFADSAGYALEPGRDTAEAVRHGSALAQAGAVTLALDRLSGTAPRLLFCGGGGQALMELTGRGGEWLPDLVFEGLELMAVQRQ